MLKKGAVNSCVCLASRTGYTGGYTKDKKHRIHGPVEAGLKCMELVRRMGHGRDSDRNHYTIKYSQVSNSALKIGNRESRGNIKQNRTRGLMP